MRFFSHLPIYYVLLSVTMTALAGPVVVTDQNHPVQNIPQDARIIELDKVNRLQAELADNLPAAPQQAEQIAKNRLETMGYPFQLAMQGAFQGAVDAFALGVTKIPAVIMDDYVVYGEPDVSQALFEIKTFQETPR